MEILSSLSLKNSIKYTHWHKHATLHCVTTCYWRKWRRSEGKTGIGKRIEGVITYPQEHRKYIIHAHLCVASSMRAQLREGDVMRQLKRPVHRNGHVSWDYEEREFVERFNRWFEHCRSIGSLRIMSIFLFCIVVFYVAREIPGMDDCLVLALRAEQQDLVGEATWAAQTTVGPARLQTQGLLGRVSGRCAGRWRVCSAAATCSRPVHSRQTFPTFSERIAASVWAMQTREADGRGAQGRRRKIWKCTGILPARNRKFHLV